MSTGPILRAVGRTTVGLAVAHWPTLLPAAELIAVQDQRAVVHHLLAQLGAAAVVTVTAVLPVLLLADDAGRQGALYATFALPGMVVGHAR